MYQNGFLCTLNPFYKEWLVAIDRNFRYAFLGLLLLWGLIGLQAELLFDSLTKTDNI
jgi:hypothetical protein